MKEYKSVKDQLLEYYMAQDHTEYTNMVIKVLSCTDPEIESSLDDHKDLNVIVAIPKQQSNLKVDISEPLDETYNMDAESSAQGASRNPPSGTIYDRPRPPRRHNASY